MREEHGTLIVPVLEEVLVVEKRLMLKEEIHIRTHRVETPASAGHAAPRRGQR